MQSEWSLGVEWLREVVTEILLCIVKDFCGVKMWEEKRACITRVRRSVVVVPWDAKVAGLIQKGTQTKDNVAGTEAHSTSSQHQRGARDMRRLGSFDRCLGS